MKRTLQILLLSASFGTLAQSERPKTLIGNDPEDISGFGAVLFSFTPIDGNLSTLTGGGGAVLFDNTFFIGGYGLGLTGNHEFNRDGEDYTTSFGHGGFWLGYNIKPDDLLHMGIETKLGWGSVSTKSVATNENVDEDEVFVFNPQFFGEANIAYWFKVNASIGYQKTIGVDNTFFDTTDFDGPTFGISLLFGWFN
ncbi:hypothetical protein [Ekhidna sp.]|jgi:hypothetical protein|uniref:hypothetical protein n=1 Tax=Ekhidna sp. TaxID=2608089 RepID=UPI0032F040F1